jgi:hypothetical protein
MLQFAMAGGQFMFTGGPSTPGIFSLISGTITSSAPSGRFDTYAFNGGSFTFRTFGLGAGSFPAMVMGGAFNLTALSSILMVFFDGAANDQCDLRVNSAGQLYFTRNGTTISSTSPTCVFINTWTYIEFKATFSTTGTGTCEARVNGSVVLSVSGLTNAVTTAGCTMVEWIYQAGSGAYLRDMYALDTGTGVDVNYLGDITVLEVFPNGAGVHSNWAANVGPYAIASVANASGGNTVYTRSVTGTEPTNALIGYNFTPTGFAHAANNVGGSNPAFFTCVASTTTTITLNNPSGVSDVGGSMPFQCIVQIGINKTGNRPNGDVAYIFDSTIGDVSDFAHPAISVVGIIVGVVHLSYLRKDATGTRSVALTCLSGAATEVGATIALGNTYQYWTDILEVDPNTSAQWSVTGFNAATFGVKEIA